MGDAATGSQAIVYHRVDRSRPTEAYFKLIHKRQGRGRLPLKKQSMGRIFFDLTRASVQYTFYALIRSARNKYRSKGRLYHYFAMLESNNRRAIR